MNTEHGEVWGELRLADAMSAIIDYRGKTPRKVSRGIPLITAKIVKGGRVLEPTEFISPDEYVSWMRRGMPQIGDVLLTSEAPLGEVGKLESSQVALAQRLFTLRSNPDLLDQGFLYYLLQSPDVQERLHQRGSGTTVQGIRSSELKEVRLPIPSLPEQRWIRSILEPLDERLQINRRMNATLEATASALFNAWFIDFEPVTAKSEGRSPFGMNDELAALFPSEFDSGIPKGWVLSNLTKEFQVNPARRLAGELELPFLEMAAVPIQGHAPESWAMRKPGAGMRFTNGDTLLARITPCLENGKACFVDFLKEGQVGYGSTEYIVLRPKPPYPFEFGYLLARSDEFRSFCIAQMTGSSGRQRVSATSLEHFDLVRPDDKVLVAFGHIVGPMFARAGFNMTQNRLLKRLRDALLAPLTTGDLRMKPSSSQGEATVV